MADILLDTQTAPTTPSSGSAIAWVESGAKRLTLTDDAGAHRGLLSRNASTASQGAGFASDTYVTNSGILIPNYGMQAGQVYRWFISVSKTAAGTAQAVYTFRIGSAQTTADTSRLALTATVAQTAAASAGLIIASVGVRSVGASGVIAGGVGLAASIGLGSGGDGVSSGFDNSALGGQYLGLSINGGASASWTITSVTCELLS